MDSLRGRFSDRDDYGDRDYDLGEDDAGHEPPPSPVGQDERRMQVRAYNHWASLLGQRSFPSIEDLEPENLPDFSPFSVLLDFTSGIEDPGIPFLGAKLGEECLADGNTIDRLSDVPSRSLLSRITDHYMQILANQAPIGFEAEFVNVRGATILYRGILLPFSSNDDDIDFIYGVINWKELADQKTSDELLLEIDQALGAVPAPVASEDSPLTAWADGPLELGPADVEPDDLAPLDLAALPEAEIAPETELELEADAPLELDSPIDPVLEGPFDAGFDPTYEEQADRIDWPAPGFGDRFQARFEPETEVEPESDEIQPLFGAGGLLAKKDRSGMRGNLLAGAALGQRAPEPEEYESDWAEPVVPEDHHFDHDTVEAVPAEPAFEPVAQDVAEPVQADHDDFGADDIAPIEVDPDAMGLADWLASARELAHAAQGSEDRSRSALYAAIGRAYDFSLAAQAEPAEFEAIVADAGLAAQDRAPMTPVVKLVFGADYDKTRLTEYASALSHGHRLGVGRGGLADFLSKANGGLKGVVQAERALKREESGKPAATRDGPRDALARKLRELEHRPLDTVAPEGQEFTLLVARRLPDGQVVLLGEVDDDVPMLERAARKLLN